MGFHGERAPDDGCVVSIKSSAPYSDVTRDASSNIDKIGNWIDRAAGGALCLDGNVAMPL